MQVINVHEYQNPVKSLDVKRLVKLITIEAHRSAAFRVVSPVPCTSERSTSTAGKDSSSGTSAKSRMEDSSTGSVDVEGISSTSKISGGLEDRAMGRSIAR